MAAVGTSIYAATRFRYAKLLHKAVYLQKAGQVEEANWCRVQTGTPPYALNDAEIYIKRFRRKGF